MRTGTAYYNLFGIGFLRLKRKVRVPESFEEMTTKQRLWYAEHVYQKYPELFRTVTRPALREPQGPASVTATEETVTLPVDEKELTVLLIRALKELSNMPGWLYWMLQADQLHELIFQQQIVNFLFTPYKTEDNPVPVLYGLKGPGSIDEVTTIRFAFADACFINWHKEQHKPGAVRDLDSFIYHLYCPDHSTSVINHKILQKVQMADTSEKILVMLWYMGHRMAFPAQYKFLFSKKNQREAAGNGSWVTVILATSNGLAHFNEVKDQSCVLFLMELNRLMEAQEKLKEEIEKRRN